MPTKRDLRIDFFRGLALLIVLVDHIEGWAGVSVIENWTLISLGFSDAAEIFIFLSGYVLAVAYAGTLTREGLAGCLRKALKRSAQIYLAYVLAALSVLVAGALLMQWNPPVYNDYFRVGDHFLSSALAVVTLRYHPWGFDILALYVLLLPCMAILLYLQRRAPEIAWLISIGAYVAVQLNPALNLPRFGDGQGWYFNPLAWQVLFFIGLYVGDPERRPIRLAPRWLLMALSTVMLLAGLFVLKISILLLQAGLYESADFMPMYRFYWAWSSKTTLQPLRLLHFFALAYVTSQVLPKNLAFWASRLARPLITAGQHSLEVYAFGLFVSFWGAYAIGVGFDSNVEIIVVGLISCAISLGFAYLVRWWKTARAPAVAPLQPDERPAASPPPDSRARSRRRKRRAASTT